MTITKSVHFSEPHLLNKAKKVSVKHQVHSELISSSVWYTKSELKAFREATMTKAKHSKESGLDLLLQGTYREDTKSDLDSFDEKRAQLLLTAWSSDRFNVPDDDGDGDKHPSYSQRGTESLISLHHGRLRKRQRQKTILGVLLAQEQCRKLALEPEVATDYIAFASKSLSKHARKFASMMGTADALAVKDDAVALEAAVDTTCFSTTTTTTRQCKEHHLVAGGGIHGIPVPT
jgi:hypothetical protein